MFFLQSQETIVQVIEARCKGDALANWMWNTFGLCRSEKYSYDELKDIAREEYSSLVDVYRLNRI